jgi:thioredoxin 1
VDIINIAYNIFVLMSIIKIYTVSLVLPYPPRVDSCVRLYYTYIYIHYFMSKKTQILLSIIALIAVGGGVFAFAANSNEAAKKTQDEKTAMEKKDTDAAMKKSEESAMMKKNEDAAMMKKTEDEGVMKKTESEAMIKKEESASPASKSTTPIVTKAEGVYTAYNASALLKADQSPTVIFFHASWCPTCKAAEGDINANMEQLKKSGVQILKTDFDTSTELRKKYGVTSQSTFVKVDSKGNELKQGQGFTTLSAITNFSL